MVYKNSMVEKINPTPSDEQIIQTMVDGAKIHLKEAGQTPNSALARAFLIDGRNRLLEAERYIGDESFEKSRNNRDTYEEDLSELPAF